MTAKRPNVIVVGGGIGGLFVANALIAQGLTVSIYEQAPALGEVGAGVFITPNSVRHLQRVGLGPAVEKWGARVGAGSQYFRHDGAPIKPRKVNPDARIKALCWATIRFSSTVMPAKRRIFWNVRATLAR